MSSKKEGEVLGISGFTLSIVALATAGAIGFLLSIVAFIFCVVQQKSKKMGFAKAGIIISIIAFILSIAWMFFSYAYFLNQISGI